jgi:primosomal protein N'
VSVVSEAAQMPAHELMSEDTKVKALYDRLLAQASQTVVPSMAAMLQQAMPVLLQAEQQLKSMMPQPPMDPAMAAVQAAAAETQRKTANDQTTNQLAAQNQQTQAQLDQQKNAILAQRNQIQQDAAAQTNQTKILTTRIDAETAQSIAATKIANGGHTSLTNGESLSEH